VPVGANAHAAGVPGDPAHDNDPEPTDQRELAELAEECRRLRQAQAISRVGSWHYDLDAGVLSATDVLLETYGVAPHEFDGTYAALESYLHPEDREVVRIQMSRAITDGQALTVRYRIRRRNDGAERWCVSRGLAEHGAEGNVVALVGTITDVTDLVALEMEARTAHAEVVQAHNYAQAVIAATPDAIHIYDVASARFTRASASNSPLLGFHDGVAGVLVGEDVDRLVPTPDRAALARGLLEVQACADGQIVHIRHQVVLPDGEVRWLSRRMTPFTRDDDGQVVSVLVVSRDVSDVVEIEQRLEHAALHDELTGLANRRLFGDRIDSALRRASRGGHVAVLVCDLDRFKYVNDTYGHHVGDAVLVEVARRMCAATRRGDTVARMGGDEFAIVLDVAAGQDPAHFAATIAGRIAAEVAQPIKVGGIEHRVSASIGIRIGDARSDKEDLLNEADAAMYEVKARGANGHAFYVPRRVDESDVA
jgi:diguanylate cyclase (GGDEF)-like protein/PAS domain S-box-containing protein